MAPQARPIDGAEGYRLFQRHNGNVELDEINEHLRGFGLREVRPRMLRHYRKLRRYGYETYMSQNRLDLAVAGEAAWSDDMRAHYREVAQPVPGEILSDAKWEPVLIESIGAASASVSGPRLPATGSPVVLRLQTTGIERAGAVTRRDPESGRADLIFDAFAGLPVASSSSSNRLTITMEVASESDSLASVTDLLVRVERLLARYHGAEETVPRVATLRKASPLVLDLLSSVDLADLSLFIGSVAATRLAWLNGTKFKYEAQGIELDNAAKKQSAQRRPMRGCSLLRRLSTQS